MVGTPSDGLPGRWYRHRGMVATLRGLWLEVRVIPVLLWSFSALTVGTALAAHGRSLEVWYYVGAVVLGALIQGLLAHCVNEVADWRSGTDRHPSPRVISGGSKVIAAGLLGERALLATFAAALVATTVLGLALVAARGLIVLPFGLVGVAGAIFYTLPPGARRLPPVRRRGGRVRLPRRLRGRRVRPPGRAGRSTPRRSRRRSPSLPTLSGC